ncbi:MAG TPA: hypothetical protein VLY03_12530 [Bacteroidota bacterium]|nr:hypothetical protein [Bacteroidota bacterium]
MKKSEAILVFVLSALILGPNARSQTSSPPTDTSKSILIVESTLPAIVVIIDSTEVGATPLKPIAVDPGNHILRFVSRDSTSWFHPATEESLVIAPHAYLHRTVRFHRVLHITTDPYGAAVQSHDSLLGTTPLYIEDDRIGPTVELSRDGFAPVTVPVPEDSREIHAVLSPLIPPAELHSLYLTEDASGASLPVLLTGGATVLTGAVAAYFKIKSDSYYSDYRLSGDQGTLQTVHRYDLISGISFAATQAGLMALTYLLFKR